MEFPVQLCQVFVGAVALYVGFFCGGEAAVLHGGLVAAVGVNHGLSDFSETADEFGVEVHIHTQEVLTDENLTVAVFSCTDSDGNHFRMFCD